MMTIEISTEKIPPKDAVVNLYKANAWSAAKNPQVLYNALLNSHGLVTAWNRENLVD